NPARTCGTPKRDVEEASTNQLANHRIGLAAGLWIHRQRQHVNALLRSALIEIRFVNPFKQRARCGPFEIHSTRNVAAYRDMLLPRSATLTGHGEMPLLAIAFCDTHPAEILELVHPDVGRSSSIVWPS